MTMALVGRSDDQDKGILDLAAQAFELVLTQHFKDHTEAIRHHYRLTALVLWKRLGRVQELLM